jgi:hypothetical protein
VTDRATGLVWTKSDSAKALNWQEALAWVARMNAANHLGHDDWRLPDVKELQSIVDYSRAPDTTRSPAIDPVLTCSEITNEAGKPDYPSYWSGTTHIGHRGGAAAMYVCFGRAGGFMAERAPGAGPPRGPNTGPRANDSSTPVRFVDVHGAGAQRSDPKAGDPKQFPRGRGPQGDVIRIYHHVRLVRGGGVIPATADQPSSLTSPRAAIPDRASEGPPDGSSNGPSNGPPSGRPGMGGARPFPASPIVTALDANHNGIIEAGELVRASEALKALDTNRDGNLSEDEFRPQRADGAPQGRRAMPPP